MDYKWIVHDKFRDHKLDRTRIRVKDLLSHQVRRLTE